MRSLYLVRHGQTPCSVRGNMCGGACDASLNESGQAMALALAQGLASLRPDAVVTSPQKRAIQTATPLAHALGQTPDELYELSELHYGSWDNLTPEEIGARDPEAFLAWLRDPAALAPPGGETVRVLEQRLQSGLATLHARYAKGRVLVVSHKTTLRVLLAHLLGVDVKDYRRRFAMPLGALTIIDFKAEGPQLRVLGDQSHLPADLRNLPGS